MAEAWRREEAPDAAVDRILDAAGRSFAERGVSASGMAEIAAAAGCSRGTLYRYFPNRHSLHLAFVNREAGRIARRVAHATARIRDPRRRAVEAILRALREVREGPATAAWFAPGTSELAARMSRTSEVVESLSDAFVSHLHGAPGRDRERRLRLRWLVRVIVSFLAQPEEDPAAERALIERYVAPLLA